MTEEQISGWEKTRKKGKFSYILGQAVLFTPFFILARAVVFYVFGEGEFGAGTLVEWLFVGFFTSLGCCAFSWYQQQNLSKKSPAQKLENNN